VDANGLQLTSTAKILIACTSNSNLLIIVPESWGLVSGIIHCIIHTFSGILTVLLGWSACTVKYSTVQYDKLLSRDFCFRIFI